MADRYIIREHSGYAAGNNPKPYTEVMVLDCDYCYQVVWSCQTSRQRTTARELRTMKGRPLLIRRAHAEKLATVLNEAHRRDMVRAMQAATVGEDVQAREGTAS